MNQPLVSIIIPCYNYARFLPDAVNSVRSQTYTNWECLIVDDGSTDSTKSIATELTAGDPRVHYLYKTNGGLSSARNHGISAAKGELVCFLDADDLLDKDKLKEQVAAFFNNPEAGIVYGNAMFFENGDPKKLYHTKFKEATSGLCSYSGQGHEMVKLLVKQNMTVVSAPLVKKDVFNKVGNFDTDYRSYEDWHFWLRCALAGYRFIYSNKPEVCTYIRFGHESMMSDKKKLLRAGIQLRRFMTTHLPGNLKLYNSYRLLRSQLKLLLTR